MAKKKTRRRPKKESFPKGADDVRQFAKELRSLADTIERCAAAMEQAGIEAIRPLVGNWDQAIEKIKVFTTRQVMANIADEAARRGHEAHNIFRK